MLDIEGRKVKIVDYIIVSAFNVVSFQNKVMEKLKEGYIFQGGVFVTVENSIEKHFQAMIKEKE